MNEILPHRFLISSHNSSSLIINWNIKKVQAPNDACQPKYSQTSLFLMPLKFWINKHSNKPKEEKKKLLCLIESTPEKCFFHTKPSFLLSKMKKVVGWMSFVLSKLLVPHAIHHQLSPFSLRHSTRLVRVFYVTKQWMETIMGWKIIVLIRRWIKVLISHEDVFPFTTSLADREHFIYLFLWCGYSALSTELEAQKMMQKTASGSH